MRSTNPIWRLHFAFGVLSASALLCFVLYFSSWHTGYLGIASALLLTVVLLRGQIRHAAVVDDIRNAMEKVSQGSLNPRVYTSEQGDDLLLAQTFNSMVTQIAERVQELQRQVGQHEAVLASMAEGVIAIDSNDRILRMNDSACAMMGIATAEVGGRAVQEVILNADVLRFVDRAKLSREPASAEISIHGTVERTLQAYAKNLRDSSWNSIGLLIVLTDITRLRHLENVRRDFVANVSHELRTPITSIKGFVETLIDGAINSPHDAKRFLSIIGRQADRLNAIFDDLLTLSRIEEGNRAGGMRLEPGRLQPVLSAAIEVCSGIAAEKQIDIELENGADVQVKLNPNLLEQAVSNLIENAIKYSEEKSTVKVRTLKQGEEVVIQVIDHGAGIEKSHLPRLFERFYRVDMARTRKAGGTGLGLAIVKHIAECHQGRPSVESKIGEGSTFAIHLPVYYESASENAH